MADDKIMYGKKEIKIVKIVNSSLFGLTFTSGGELPKELEGRYTSPKLAREAVVAAALKNKKK